LPGPQVSPLFPWLFLGFRSPKPVVRLAVRIDFVVTEQSVAQQHSAPISSPQHALMRGSSTNPCVTHEWHHPPALVLMKIHRCRLVRLGLLRGQMGMSRSSSACLTMACSGGLLWTVRSRPRHGRHLMRYARTAPVDTMPADSQIAALRIGLVRFF
jgi:hypothetical protein